MKNDHKWMRERTGHTRNSVGHDAAEFSQLKGCGSCKRGRLYTPYWPAVTRTCNPSCLTLSGRRDLYTWQLQVVLPDSALQ